MKLPLKLMILWLLLTGALLYAKHSTEKQVARADIGTDFKVFLGNDEDTHLDKSPPRDVKGMNLKSMSWSYNCMECHNHVEEPRWDRKELLVEHDNIKLKHGNNRYCLNCHHPSNRNAFVDYNGSEIPEQDVVMLCAKCHGPKYRDWKAGVHGRQNGYWDETKGPKAKLRCIQCHDPHHPNYQSIKPLPPLVYPPRAAHSDKEHKAEHE